MTCVDWRTCAHHEVAPLLAAEIEAWRRDLDWDVTEAWQVVEPARHAGQLPGFVVRDARGGALGWTAFLLHRGTLQVLALAASSAEASNALADAILTSPEAAQAASVLFCIRGASPDLGRALEARGFALDPYRYLALDLRAAAATSRPRRPAPPAVRPWRDDGPAFAALCGRAYADSREIRAFAPSGTAEEWQDYVDSLLVRPGCGWFRPELTRLSGAGMSLDGAVFVTDLGLGTAHVAQLVVAPPARGRGLATTLMEAAVQAASVAGYGRMTLLVSGANPAAAAIYAALGFRDRAAFLVATRSQPTLSTSDAFATGGESTRR